MNATTSDSRLRRLAHALQRLLRIENWDKQQDQQRHMAWVAMGSMVVLTLAQLRLTRASDAGQKAR